MISFLFTSGYWENREYLLCPEINEINFGLVEKFDIRKLVHLHYILYAQKKNMTNI